MVGCICQVVLLCIPLLIQGSLGSHLPPSAKKQLTIGSSVFAGHTHGPKKAATFAVWLKYAACSSVLMVYFWFFK